MHSTSTQDSTVPSILIPFRVAVRNILRSSPVSSKQLLQVVTEERDNLNSSYPPTLTLSTFLGHSPIPLAQLLKSRELAEALQPFVSSLSSAEFQLKNLSIEHIEMIGLYFVCEKQIPVGLVERKKIKIETDWFRNERDSATHRHSSTISFFDAEKLANISVLNDEKFFLLRLLHWYYFTKCSISTQQQSSFQQHRLPNPSRLCWIDFVSNACPHKLSTAGWNLLFFKYRNESSLQLQNKLRMANCIRRFIDNGSDESEPMSAFKCLYLVRLVGLAAVDFYANVQAVIESNSFVTE